MSEVPIRRPIVTPPFRGQAGRCCWCGTALKGRQRRWCSVGCVDAYLIAKGDQGRARRVLWKRDAGRCAICGTTPSERKLASLSLVWEADHAVPIAEGGALSIENLRTLCVSCHRSETAELRRRMAERARRKRLDGAAALFRGAVA